MLNRIKDYAMGMGNTPLIQNIVDYGTAAALGATGQQVMNMVTPGADPNPLLSGALAAPMLAAGLRSGRGFLSPKAMNANDVLLSKQFANPYESAVVNASTAAGLSGLATSGLNTFTGGIDYDNNVIAANVTGGRLLGSALLAGLALLSASLISKVRNTSPRPVA